MDERGVLHDEGVGLGDGLVGADGPVVDPAVGDHRRTHPLRAEAGERLGVPPLVEGRHRQDLGGGHHALAAPAVDPDLEHGLPTARDRRRCPDGVADGPTYLQRMPLLVPRRPTGPTADGSHARGDPVGRVGPNGPGRDRRDRRSSRRSASPSRRVRPPVTTVAEGGTMATGPVYIRRFGEFGIGDVPTVGGKTAGLGEMYRSLSAEGVRVPDGFAVTADAYRHVLEAAGALGPLHDALDGLDPDDLDDLARRAARARAIVYDAGLPDGPGRRDPRRLPAPAGRVRGRRRPGRPLVGHRRGPADGELRRPAGDVPQHPGRGGAARGLPEVLRQPVHRPLRPLPGRRGVRPVPGGAVDRRS